MTTRTETRRPVTSSRATPRSNTSSPYTSRPRPSCRSPEAAKVGWVVTWSVHGLASVQTILNSSYCS